MVESRTRVLMKYGLAVAWLLFTMTFALWWMYFGLKQLGQLGDLLPDHASELARHRRMMIWEGAAWMVLLLAGGGTLIAFVAREAKRTRRLKEFFAAFSHDVKTSLASLRLQTESLLEDLSDRRLPVLERLVADTVRLNLQLENSLFLASDADLKLFVEDLSLARCVERLRVQWPGLEVSVEGDARLRADERALNSVLANLIQNAVVHGRASRIRFSPREIGVSRVVVEFRDNGQGFSGDFEALGQPFFRPSSASGSGVGLYISRMLVRRMGGDLRLTSGPGFGGSIELQGRLA